MNIFSFIGSYLDRSLGVAKSRELKHQFDVSWAFTSIVFVVFVLCSSVYMLIQQPVVLEIAAPPNQIPTVTLNQDSDSYVSSPIGMNPKVGEARYHAFLTDEHGNQVFTYPDIILDLHHGTRVDAGNLKFKIPQIPPGTYFLHADIKYPLNPLKTADLKVKIAKVIITGDRR